MDCLILSFGFDDKYPKFGYELNKLNNYLMATRPILAIGNKKNLSIKRGNFTFVQKNDAVIFEKKLSFIKNDYSYYLKIAQKNKKKYLKRNNPIEIFESIEKKLKKL